MELFEAVSVVASLGGADRIDGLDSPLVARHRELRLVKELFHATQESGRPTVLVVQGEPGVGKSRLAWEFEKYVDGLTANVRWHRGRCLSYGEGVAFWALSEAVRVRLGLVDADMGPVPLDQLDEAMRPWVPDETERAWLRPRMAALMGTETLEPASKEELFSAWVTFFERVGGGEPVVLVVDDVQYADDTLLDFFEHLLVMSRSPMFVLLLARTGLVERRPSLATSRRATVLHLEPLSDHDMGLLVDGLVGGLPSEVRGQLVERAEGVPLFAVETVRSLIDRDLVVPSEGQYVLADGVEAQLSEMAAPASLQALVAARLDALSADERKVVSAASVLGLFFTVEGITVLAGEHLDLEAVLTSLVGKQILSLQSDRFSAEFGQYRFVQAVVRQVSYEMLSRRDRKARHLAVAAWLEATVDPNDDVAGVVAQHYLDAVDSSVEGDGDVADLVATATRLLERAAVRAMALGAHAEAVRYLTRAQERTTDAAAIARMVELEATALLEQSRPAQALDRVVENSSATRRSATTSGSCGCRRCRAGPGRARTQHRRRRAAGSAVGRHVGERREPQALALVAKHYGAAMLALGEQQALAALLDRWVLIAEGLGGEADLAEALGSMGLVYWTRGAPFIGRQLLESSAELALANGLTMIAARALSNLAALAVANDLNQALEYGLAAREQCLKSGRAGYIQLSATNYGIALWTAGRWDELETVLAGMGEEPDGSTMRSSSCCRSCCRPRRGSR